MEPDLLRVAVVTPTYGRAVYLSRTLDYFRAQKRRGMELHWFILDDGPDAHPVLSARGLPDVSYDWQPTRMLLGAKRNRLNEMALAWGAHFVCAMDDDDWYGPSYVADMVGMSRDSDGHFAGSYRTYYYDISTGNILLAQTAPRGSSGNGVLCYRAAALQAARYPDGAASGEDRVFLGDNAVLQHPDISLVHLALLHGRNTEDKRVLLRSADVRGDMSLASFAMRVEDAAFYQDLHKQAARAGHDLMS
ncbi:MAG: putative glysosyltransferase [Ferruginibacter sp.]|nr:putative glysosyltransferase [Ferruginibacter sp.]